MTPITDAEPEPLLSSRNRWTVASFAFAAAALLLFGLWLGVSSLSDSLLLGSGVAVGSFVAAIVGMCLAVVGLLRREGVGALAALLVSAFSALPIAPTIFLLLALVATAD